MYEIARKVILESLHHEMKHVHLCPLMPIFKSPTKNGYFRRKPAKT